MKIKTLKLKNISDIPPSIISGHYIEIYGSEEMVLTGKTEITKLEDTVLKIKCNEHGISISGKSLEILSYTFDGIKIKGEIDKIEFERGE